MNYLIYKGNYLIFNIELLFSQYFVIFLFLKYIIKMEDLLCMFSKKSNFSLKLKTVIKIPFPANE